MGRRTPGTVENVITGLAHSGVRVPDREAAVAFYRGVSRLRLLSPRRGMAGNAIHDDMGEVVSYPTMQAGGALTDHGARLVMFALVLKSRPERPSFAQSGA